MKKIIIVFLLMLFQFTLASLEDDLAKTDTMPTDEEIMEAIKSYHFDAKKEEKLFNQVKKQFKKMYKEKNNQNIEVNIETQNKN